MAIARIATNIGEVSAFRSARRACLGVALGSIGAIALAQQPAGPSVAFVGDSVPLPLTAIAGDPARGKNVVVSREKGHCILCHAVPEAEVRFAGNVGPPLAGVAGRLSVAELRGRIVDPTRHDANSGMPAYFRTDGLHRVAGAYAGRTALAAQDVEDAVAYLSTLR